MGWILFAFIIGAFIGAVSYGRGLKNEANAGIMYLGRDIYKTTKINKGDLR